MTENRDKPDKSGQVEGLLATPDLAGALESEQFRRFLDQIPIAIAVAEMSESEHIVYANPEVEKLSGCAAAEVESKSWNVIPGQGDGRNTEPERKLGTAVVQAVDYVGTFCIERAERAVV